MNRTQIILLVAVLGMASFYAWSKVHKLEVSEKEYQEARYYPNLENDDVERIKVVSSDPKFEYELVRKADQWYIDSHLVRIDKSYQLVSSITELSRDREMEASPDAEREKEFHLDSPAYSVTVWKNGGEDMGTVKLGKRTPDFNHYYGQWARGGPVSTVPAYTLGTLEEKPDDLRETSLFPVEWTSVERFTISKDGKTVVELESAGGKDKPEKYTFVQPEKMGTADESKVKDYLQQLKDLKVGRFLAEDEKPPMGDTTVRFQAKLGFTDNLQITELKGRVPVKPSMVYGVRYLAKPEGVEPLPETMERFVVELSAGGEVANPTARLFEDRRVAVFDMDKLKSLTLSRGSEKLEASKNSSGKWAKGEHELPEGVVNGLLWTLKDLRYEALDPALKDSQEGVTLLQLKGEEAKAQELRFIEPQNGKPYLWRDSKGYTLPEGSWGALSDSISKLMKDSSDLDK